MKTNSDISFNERKWKLETLIELDKDNKAQAAKEFEKEMDNLWLLIENAISSQKPLSNIIIFKEGVYPNIDKNFDTLKERIKALNFKISIINGSYKIDCRLSYDVNNATDTPCNTLIDEDKY